ncbi:SWIM zinc finger domain-containing protein [Solirubrobacter phytolaccae]|uniref:SWIM zinc finger domain-containing protein n=1 Tax=Solirubrobacter phytolaccae TaxID=1404360 RepID=A0A9X3NF94_9ACTN|nr:SWIM zinc finger family protein [Solirubrobacter phytolaccae]MDA0183056.1 SWIM zinc finger domain-containing protein [Solirubrobacter phytolaccae]
MIEHAYTYAHPSTATADALDLATSGGVAAHPHLFRGELNDPAIHASAILAVARTARARFFEHGKVITDPVVTCHADRIRFEALSSCAGVYARHDALLSGADGEVLRVGVTNVDVNEATRGVLARVGGTGWLHLAVGEDEVQVAGPGGVAVERKVALPTRWVKGFGEVGVASRALQPGFELSGVAAQRFLRTSVPRTREVFLMPGGRWSVAGGAGAVAVRDPERLKLLEPLARFGSALRVWGGPTGVSAFTLTLGTAGTFTLVLSPASSRGFSGEGGSLNPLATEALQPQADDAELDLAWQPKLAGDPAVLDVLAARGRAGFDLDAGGFFHRDLPYDLTQVEALHPRLLAARKLVPEVRWEGDHAWVGQYRVSPPACTCEWWGRYRGERGPCKHVLAAELARDA